MMNCVHIDDGWCLDCVIKLNARMEAAEADNIEWRTCYTKALNSELQQQQRAEAAETQIRLLTERVLRLARSYARDTADWLAVRIQCGEQPPFTFLGDTETRELYTRAEAAEAKLELMQAEINSEIHALQAQFAAANLDAARLAGAVQEAKALLSLAQPRPGVTPEWQPRYDRWLAANGTTSAEVDAAVDSHAVDALARRVYDLERRLESERSLRWQTDGMERRVEALELALTGNADQYGNLIRRVDALEVK
jgi:hypothetical protein